MAENHEHSASWAIDLLTRKAEEESSVLSVHGGPIFAAVAGFITALYVNHASQRPLMSGIQKHIAFPILFASAGYWLQQRREHAMAERDAVLRHYISLHPEDFPEPERKKFADVLNPWTPIR